MLCLYVVFLCLNISAYNFHFYFVFVRKNLFSQIETASFGFGFFFFLRKTFPAVFLKRFYRHVATISKQFF